VLWDEELPKGRQPEGPREHVRSYAERWPGRTCCLRGVRNDAQ
jgi:hypothetical protein